MKNRVKWLTGARSSWSQSTYQSSHCHTDFSHYLAMQRDTSERWSWRQGQPIWTLFDQFKQPTRSCGLSIDWHGMWEYTRVWIHWTWLLWLCSPTHLFIFKPPPPTQVRPAYDGVNIYVYTLRESSRYSNCEVVIYCSCDAPIDCCRHVCVSQRVLLCWSSQALDS